MKRVTTLMVLAAVALGACADGANAPNNGLTSSTETTVIEASETTVPDTSPPDRTASTLPELPVDTSAIPAGVMVSILADAATRSGISASDIYAVRAEQTLWNDGSMGCPQPGMSYTQAQVDGHRVVLKAGDTSLDYRASESGFFVFCAFPTAGSNETSDK